MDWNSIPQRPRHLSENDVLECARELVDNLVREGHVEETERVSAARDIARWGRGGMDGYALAKELDLKAGWECYLDMAEALDAWSGIYDGQIRVRVKEWEDANGVVPEFGPGDEIVALWGGDRVRGIVRSISGYDVAKYSVEPLDEVGIGPGGLMVIDFENASSPASPFHAPS